MSVPHLHLLCNIERIGPSYVDGYTYFSLNLTIGLADGGGLSQEEMAALVQPWRWQAWDWRQPGPGRGIPPGLTVRGFTPDWQPAPGAWQETHNTSLPWEPVGAGVAFLEELPPAEQAKLLSGLDQSFAACCLHIPPGQLPPLLAWNAATGQATIEVESLPGEDRPVLPWRATLAQLWSEPQPVSLLLRLAVFFRLATADLRAAGVTHLVAAPCLPAGWVPGLAATSPLAGGLLRGLPPVKGTPDQLDYEWPYALLPTLQVTAHLEPAPVEITPAAESFINLATLLVEPPTAILADAEAQAEHWQQRLPALLTDAFQLPRLVLDAVRQAQETGAALPAELASPAQLADVVQAALHDQAHAGALRPPDGQSLAAAFVRAHLVADVGLQANTRQIADLSEQLEDWLLSLTPDLATWKLHLQGVLPDVTTQVQLATQPETGLPPAEALANMLSALETLSQALAERPLLEKLIHRQWPAAMIADPLGQISEELAQFWRATGPNKLAAFLARPELEVDRYIARGTIQAAWSRLPGLGKPSASGVQALNSGADAERFLQAELTFYLQGRCLDATTPDYRAYQPVLPAAWAALSPSLEPAIERRTQALCSTYVRPAAPAVADRTGSAFAAEPEGLVFQLDHTVRDTTDTAHDRADSVRRVAGTLLMLRRTDGQQPATDWYCANYARLTGLPSLGTVLVPAGYGYADDLRQAVLTYRNRPFGVPSVEDSLSEQVAVAASAANGLTVPEDEDMYAAENKPLLAYLPAYTGSPNAPRLLPLGYGHQYEGFVGVVSTAGALPAALADNNAGNPIPWRLKPDHQPDARLFHSLAAAIQTREFLRRQAVGHLVTLPLTTSSAPGPVPSRQRQGGLARPLVPPLPASVSPLARVLALPAEDEKASLVLLPGPDASNPWKSDFADTSRVSFAVFRPSTTFGTWQRWTTADTSGLGRDDAERRATIKAVVASEFRLRQQGNTAADSRPDGTLDDPAVSHLSVRAECVWSPQGKGKAETKQFPFPGTLTSAATPLQRAQWNGLQVHIQAVNKAESFALNPLPGGSGVEVRVPEGQIWRLQLLPQVTQPTARARFAPGLLNADGLPLRPRTGAEGAQSLDSGLRFLVEVATASLAANPSKVLHQSLTLNSTPLQPNAAEAWIEVALDGSVGDAIKVLPYLHRLETIVQRWRWHGLPLQAGSDAQPETAGSGFPFKAFFDSVASGLGKDDQDNLLAPYDATLFATRSSDDCLLVPATFAHSPTETELHIIHRQPRPPFPGAQYHRFAVRAYHRYEGVMRHSFAYDSRVKAAENNTEALEQWRRHVYRCSFNQTVPPPLVQALLPLATGGLSLLVMGEGAYQSQVAGLAEYIEAEVLSVAAPDDSGWLAQLGPDPTLAVALAPIPADAARARPVLGPVGYTFDTGSSIPTYGRASYFWQSPVVPTEEGNLDLTNFLVKVRFRRAIEAAGHTAPASAPHLVSDWTPAFWTRILAPIDQLLVQAVIETDIKQYLTALDQLVYDRQSRCFRDRNAGNTAVLPCPSHPIAGEDPTGRLAHVFYVLITQVVADALGRADEAFYSLHLLNPQLAPGPLPVDPLSNLTKPVIRLVELRFDATHCPLQDLIDLDNQPDADIRNLAFFDLLLPVPKTLSAERSQAIISRVTQKIAIV